MAFCLGMGIGLMGGAAVGAGGLYAWVYLSDWHKYRDEY
jgi:hypothetical protein